MTGSARSAADTGRAVLAVPVLALLWGFNWPAVKTILAEVAPWTLRSMGMGCSALLLMAAARISGRSLRVPRDQWPRLVAAGLLSVAGFNLLVAFAQLAGTTSRAAIVTFTMPIWAILLARPVLGERLDRRRAAALALGIAGLALLTVPALRADGLPRGILFSLAAGWSWAAGTVFTKRFPIRAGLLGVVAWQLWVGALAAAAGMLLFEGLPHPRLLSPRASFALGYHVLLATALAYFLWFEIVARVPAGIASLGTLLVPVVGVSSAMTLLGERLSATDLGGFALITAAAATAALPAAPWRRWARLLLVGSSDPDRGREQPPRSS